MRKLRLGGQSIVEYIVILVIVSVISVAFVPQIPQLFSGYVDKATKGMLSFRK